MSAGSAHASVSRLAATKLPRVIASVDSSGFAATHSDATLPSKGDGKGPGYCTGYAGGVTSSYKFEDVYACEGTTTGSTTFDNPGTGVYAWQCVELAARFLWAVDGIWAGPGSGVVDGADLVSVVHANNPGISVGTPGPGSVPAAGDVISLGPGGGSDPTSGHTAVVISADPSTGQFKIMSENAPDGTAGEQSLKVDLSGGHNGEVRFFGVWTQASWLETAKNTWGTAQEVPGTAALNVEDNATLNSVSCASAGNCSAGGTYRDGANQQQAFVVSQVNGTWGTAVEVPGTAALNTGGNATVTSVSCASAGNCTAGGQYLDASGYQAFVVSDVNGTWGTAVEVPGTAALNTGGNATVTSVSCASAGKCSAGGYYWDSSNFQQAFVVSEVKGTWGSAIAVPGTAALNVGGLAQISSVSCASAGNCTAGGNYGDVSGYREDQQLFVVSQVNGTWGNAEEIPGIAALNTGQNADVASVSCGSAGNCSAGGSYNDGTAGIAFVVSEVNGTWATAEQVPGMTTLNTGYSALNSISCASAGNCSAGGWYSSGTGYYQAFVVTETNGSWGSAEEAPGTGALNAGGNASVTSVSCASAGNCSAGGTYKDGSNYQQAFVISQVNGTWGTAVEVPGTAALNVSGNASVTSVSCASAGKCSAGGNYWGAQNSAQVFVVSEGLP
jgi:hypothetical protein